MKKSALNNILLLIVICCIYSCGKKEAKILERYQYIEDIARENGFDKGGIMAIRDTTAPMKDYPAIYGFRSDGKLIRTAGSCVNGILPAAKEIIAAADDPSKADSIGTLSLFLFKNPIYLLTGERLETGMLPEGDVYLFYDYNPVAFAIEPGHLRTTNHFVNNYSEKRIVFVKLCMMDFSKALQNGTKQISF